MQHRVHLKKEARRKEVHHVAENQRCDDEKPSDLTGSHVRSRGRPPDAGRQYQRIVTDQDLVTRVLANGHDPRQTTLEGVLAS